jgi:hypothetical protein
MVNGCREALRAITTLLLRPILDVRQPQAQSTPAGMPLLQCTDKSATSKARRLFTEIFPLRCHLLMPSRLVCD